MKTSSLPFLPDSSVLVHYARRDELYQFIEAAYALEASALPPAMSAIIVGEIRAFALLRKWGETKRGIADKLVARCSLIPIEREDLIDAYAKINNYSISVGRPMGDNDLWIAATARVTGATLLTTDKDFDHLHPQFLTRIYIEPKIK